MEFRPSSCNAILLSSILWDEIPRSGLTSLLNVSFSPCAPANLRILFPGTKSAVATLLRWYREGIDPNCRLMYVATFVGHTDPNSTAVYLTITEELLSFRALAPRGGDQCIARSCNRRRRALLGSWEILGNMP